MFTGIVEERGEVRALERRDGGGRLEIACHDVLADTPVGGSVAVDGCCVTVTGLDDEGFRVDLMAPTLAATTLGDLAVGASVNLERPLAVGGRLGGHLVQGHVDGVGEVLAGAGGDGSTMLRMTAPPGVAEHVVPRGSVAVQGVSLTVAEVAEAPEAGAPSRVGVVFAVGLVPHTLEVTTLGRLRPGDRVNLEADVIAKHVARLLAAGAETPYARD